jgi:peptide/nickel transport system substrate-binding protein
MLNPILKKNLKIAGAGLYIAVLAMVGYMLFSGGQISFLGNSINPNGGHSAAMSRDELKIAYAYMPKSLEPTLFDSVTRSYLADIYEGLVKTDRNLIVQPAVAVSWGLVDPTTWEFRLRDGIKFHNGRFVTVDDVIASIERARNFEGSELKSLLNNIDSVSANGSDRVRIKTKAPDPLLLNKLAVTFIFPAAMSDFEKPVGTGPYRYVTADQSKMILNAFDGYWSEKPAFKQVDLMLISDRNDRVSALEKNEVQLLANLPPSVACSKTDKYKSAEGCTTLKNPDISIKSIPSLEVSFLAFNRKVPLFEKQEVRDAIIQALDPQTFVDLAYGFARPVGQYVSNGVFGFSPDVKKLPFDITAAKAVLKKITNADTFTQLTIDFDYPGSLQAIGQYVQQQLEELGIVVNLNPLSDEALLEKIKAGTSELYFLGWRSELGDSLDFLQAVAHSKDIKTGYGLYNGANYMNKNVDQLIEKAQSDLNTNSRLKTLQDAMKIISQDDVYGVPMYESETIFAYSNDITFEPRVDGYIHASEIK